MITAKRAGNLPVIFIIILYIIFFFSGCKTTNQNNTETTFSYSNPIINKYLADPVIIQADGYYYLFATGGAQDGRRIPIHRSTDLVDWEFVRGAVARGAEGSWNRRNFWAPEVFVIDGKYCLYYTASTDNTPQNTGNRVGLAVSDKPEGPYEDKGVVHPG